MDLQVTQAGQAVVLHVSGRLDLASAEAFKAALLPHLDGCRPGGAPVILALSGVDYIGSAGLRVLMLAARQAKAQDGRIAIADLQPVVREIFEIARFTLVFACLPTIPEALAWVARDRPEHPGGT